MQLKKNEIVINRKELSCLNAFAGKDPKMAQLYGAAIQTQKTRLIAYASDGSKCIRATAKAEAEESQEWLIPRDVVSFAIRTLRGEQDAHFQFSASGVITKFQIWGLDPDGVDVKGEEIVLKDPVPAQTLFPFQRVKDALEKVPGSAVNMANLPSDAAKAIASIYGAAGTELVRLEFPRAEGAPLLVTADGPTTWEASIIRQSAPAPEPEDEEDDEGDGPLFDRAKDADKEAGSDSKQPHEPRKRLRLVRTEPSPESPRKARKAARKGRGRKGKKP
jgi:hypothetical protein